MCMRDRASRTGRGGNRIPSVQPVICHRKGYISSNPVRKWHLLWPTPQQNRFSNGVFCKCSRNQPLSRFEFVSAPCYSKTSRILSSFAKVNLRGNDVLQSLSRNEMCHPSRPMKFMSTRYVIAKWPPARASPAHTTGDREESPWEGSAALFCISGIRQQSTCQASSQPVPGWLLRIPCRRPQRGECRT